MSETRTKPGLFITATDTEVGKTIVTCGIARILRKAGVNVAATKPIASGCEERGTELVNADAEALMLFSGSEAPMRLVNPVRFRAPLAPAVAAEEIGQPVDENAVVEAIAELDATHDVVLIEGIGGLLVPLSDHRTVLDLAIRLGYPVLVVTRPGLGTLNHTAMTCRLIREAGLRLAGLVVNGTVNDLKDPSTLTNARWMERQNGTTVLARVPRIEGVAPARGELSPAILHALEETDWLNTCQPPT